MILQTQSRSSSEKGYIADTRPRNFDAGISAASPYKTNTNMMHSSSKSPIYKVPEKTKLRSLVMVCVKLSRPSS